MTAPALAKSEYDVCNTVALKRMATPTTIAQVTGHPADEIDNVLDELARRGLVVRAGEASLATSDAVPALAQAASQLYAELREDQHLLELVDRFDIVNKQFLVTMSAWQQVDIGGRKVLNDHSDADYDEKVIAKLIKLVDRLDALVAALGEYDRRFGSYSQRFATALYGVDSGRTELVSSAVDDSVHNIWHEFHEDLLRTLGRERSE